MFDKNKTRQRAPQQRQIERVRLILDTALEHLKVKSIEELSFNEISETTGIVLPSIYYYYPNKNALIIALSSRIKEQLSEKINTSNLDLPKQWPIFWQEHLLNYANYLNQNPSIIMLLLGSGTSKETKEHDYLGNNIIAHAMCNLFARQYQNFDVNYHRPHFEVAMAILDGIWHYAYYQHHALTDDLVTQAITASTSYSRNYLPAELQKI